MLAQASADSLSEDETSVFAYVFPAQAGYCFCRNCILPPAVFLVLLFWCEFLKSLGCNQGSCVFPDSQGAGSGGPPMGMHAASLGRAGTPLLSLLTRIIGFLGSGYWRPHLF